MGLMVKFGVREARSLDVLDEITVQYSQYQLSTP